MVRTLTALMFALGLALTAPLFAEEPPTPDTPLPDVPEEPVDEADEADEAPAKLPRVMKPFLWRIEGDVPSYLFGTMHVSDPRVLAMHPLVVEAYQKADAVGFELDLIKDAAGQIKVMQLPEGELFEEIVPKALADRLDARLRKISPMVSRQVLAAANITNLRPAAWGILVGSLDELIKNMGKDFLDAKLQGDARKDGKEVVAMETPEGQGGLFLALTKEEGVVFLEACLDGYDELDNDDDKELSAEMVEVYLAGDEDALLKAAADSMMPEGNMTQALIDKVWAELSYKRNARMAKKFMELRAANPTKRYLIAVGAVHVSGPKNVQHYLKQAGVSTTRVTGSLDEEVTTPPVKKEEPAREPAGAGAK